MIRRPAPTGSTVVAGVIGDPVAHSLSPALHNAAFAAADLDWTHVALPVPAGRGGDAVDAMRTLGIRGLSVTMPHKEAVAEAADEVTPAVEALGAANCLVLGDDGRVTAHNTDGAGFVRAFETWSGEQLLGKSVAVLGAGGAARAVIDACARVGAREVRVVNRTVEKAERAAALAGNLGVVGAADHLGEVQVVINATSVGMADNPGMPCDPSQLGPGRFAVDLIYHPRETAWLAAARANGARTQNGLAMLLHQAAVQFRLWTGVEPPIAAMEAAVAP